MTPRRVMVLTKRVRACCAWLLAINMCGCLANDLKAPGDWREDCVGRLTLLLPEDSEPAVDSTLSLRKRGLRQSEYDYSNGFFSFGDDESGWTDFRAGPIRAVSPILIDSQIAVLRDRDTKDMHEFVASGKKRAATEQGTFVGGSFDTGDPRVSAYFGLTGMVVFAQIEQRVVRAGYGLEAGDFVHDRNIARRLAANIRAREMFDVPKEPGLCYPYVFAKDDGSLRRYIAVDYRSKARPDFHVVLWDATAANPDKEGIDPSNEKSRRNTWRNSEPDREIVSFWGQRHFEGATKPEWLTLTRHVELAGRSGLQSFIRLERPNGTVDYEYYAVVRGDPKAKEDTPDIKLYVYTSNDYGKKKGLTPIPKEEFLKMAQTVAASIKRRPVQ